MSFSSSMKIWRCVYNFKSTFMLFCIVQHGIPSSTYRLWVDICGDVATDSSTNSHCYPLVDDFRFIGLSFMLPITQTLCYHRRNICFGGNFVAESLLEIVTHVTYFLPCLWTFVWSDTDNDPLFSGVIALYFMAPFALAV